MTFLRTVFVVLISGIIVLPLGGAGCSILGGDGDDRREETLVAKVDSVIVPSRIAPTDTLRVRMRGSVGPNSCYRFEEFDVLRATGRLTITPVVVRTTADDIACATVVVPLNRTYTAAPPFDEGTLTITVPQPDQPDVTTSVDVTAEE